MAGTVSPTTSGPAGVRGASRSTRVFDVLLALGCTVVAVALHRSQADGVEANRTSDLVSTALTVIAVARPVDLSLQGIAVNGVLLVVGGVLGTGVRERKALHDAQVAAARQELALERERADRAALEELRRLLSVIRDGDRTASSSHELVGLDALAALVADVTAAGLPVRLSCDVARGIPAGVRLAAYRIVQEALTNTLRHAGPATASVAVRQVGNDLLIDVTDDGRGAALPRDGAGRGVAGMRERVAVYGGTLTTGSGPHGGYRVEARIPLEARSPSAPATEGAVTA